MKIGIDTFGCEHSKSGNGSYLINFVQNLPNNADIQYELFGYESDRYLYKSQTEYSYISIAIDDNFKAEKRWHKFHINKFIKKQGYDLVLFPAADKLLPSKKHFYKGAAVVNSILSKREKIAGSVSIRNLLKSLNNFDYIIATSNFIKNDLIDLGINKDKITVIYSGIEHKLFFPSLNTDSEFVEIKPFSIKKPYFVYGSRLSGPDKKHLELIKAFELFKKITGAPHRLVIAGSDEDYGKEIHNIAFESEYASDIFITGYFPHDSFAKLYSDATACIFPAINEGVGLPIIEAMACGIPVLCSDSGALTETGGDAPIFFNSDNIPEIAECMQKIIKDDDLLSSVIQKGLIQSQKFSWEDTVTKTLALFGVK